MNQEQEKKNYTLLIVIVVAVLVVFVLGYFIFFKAKPEKPSLPNEEEPKGLYTMNKTELTTFTHKLCGTELTALSSAGKVIINYPVFNGTDESIAALNATISDKVNGYKDNYVLNGIEITNEDIKTNGEGCSFVIESSDKKMNKYDYYEHLDYEIIDTTNYLYIIENFHLEMGNERADSDIFNVYNIDKNTGKAVENSEIVKSIENLTDIKTKITNLVELDEEKNYDFLDAAAKKKLVNNLKTKLDKNEFKVYYQNDGNLVIVLNELEMWSTYEFMYDKLNNTVSIK